jgi:AbrB family looped-hinge helix DNA binding protein
MKATLTSKGQVTIPAAIRRRLGLEAGHVVDFDETTPYLKATVVFDEDAMRSVLGCAQAGAPRSADWLDATRGPVDTPKKP